MVFSFVSCDDNANEEPKPEEKTEYTLEVPGYVLASEESFKATIKGSDGTEKEVEINTPETKGYVEVSSGDLKATVLVVDKVYDKNTTEPPVFGADEYILLDNVEYSNIPGIVIEAENVHVYGNNACLKIENAPNNFVLLTLKNKVFIDGISFDVSLESGTGTIIEAQENSSGFEVTNCSFKGNYKDGDDRTLRAFLCGSGYDATGWKIENCTFDSVRQPMYVETAGSILNNTIKNTRGWVICDNIKGLVFKGNSFEGWNAEDVAIIEEGGEAEDDRIFTNDACIELSNILRP